jgi:hypothetical protein
VYLLCVPVAPPSARPDKRTSYLCPHDERTELRLTYTLAFLAVDRLYHIAGRNFRTLCGEAPILNPVHLGQKKKTGMHVVNRLSVLPFLPPSVAERMSLRCFNEHMRARTV